MTMTVLDQDAVTPTIATEVEYKFEVPADFTIPDLSTIVPGSRLGAAQLRLLDAIYLDTTELTLLRLGITLRRRSGGHDAGWHLKLPRAHGERVEMHMPLSDSAYTSELRAPAGLTRRVNAYVQGASLRPVARLRTHRVAYPLLGVGGIVLAEFAVDDVLATVLLKAATLPISTTWSELEVELVEGDRPLLEAIRGLLLTSGARAARTASKLERALSREL